MEEMKKVNRGIDPMIFNDPTPKKGINPMIFEAPNKSVEQKTYLVLVKMQSKDDNEFNELSDGSFKICTGRTECFRYIEKLCQSFGDDFDPYESIVITETKQTETKTENIKYYMINLEEAISVYAFCKSVEGFYGKYGFRIDDYFSSPVVDENNNDDIAFIEQAVHKEYSKLVNQNEGKIGIDGKVDHLGHVSILKLGSTGDSNSVNV